MLWFEHDLYDQLQLIQVLDGLAELRGPPISLVCEAEYLGNMEPERAAELFALRNPVTRRHMQEARAAWTAFRSSDPRNLETVKIVALPFLAAAIRRHLEEFPWTTDGLSRTERQILAGNTEEEPAFMGDVVLEWHRERIEKNRRFPRWLGGYEVKDETLRWDPLSSVCASQLFQRRRAASITSLAVRPIGPMPFAHQRIGRGAVQVRAEHERGFAGIALREQRAEHAGEHVAHAGARHARIAAAC